MILLKTVIFTFVAPGAVTVYFPYLLLSARHSPRLGGVGYFGIVPILFGALVYLRCAGDFVFAGKGTPAAFDPPRELVVRGLYRYMRNPMYTAIITVLLGEALLFHSEMLIGYAAVVYICFYLFVAFCEEPALRRKFGESYERYCADVPRWIPRIAR